MGTEITYARNRRIDSLNNLPAACVLHRAVPRFTSPFMPLDFSGQRVLIFIVAYNAEKTIDSVLDRIPQELRTKDVEVLIIDDSSKDATFQTGLKREDQTSDFKITILRTPVNQGYGGNQKLGYRY